MMNQDLSLPSVGMMTADGDVGGEAPSIATGTNDNLNDASTLAAMTNTDDNIMLNVSSPLDAVATSTTGNPPAVTTKKTRIKPTKKPLGTPVSPHFRAIVQSLAANVDFFREHTNLNDLEYMYYTEVPSNTSLNGRDDGGDGDNNSNIDWGNSNSITKAFPVLKGRGKLVIPLALIFEADDIDGKLVVINYWRLLKAEEQRKIRDTMRSFYLRPSMSNERINLNVAKRVVQAKDSSTPGTTAEATVRTNTVITATDPENIQGISITEAQAFAQARGDLMNRVRFFNEVAPLDGMNALFFHSVLPDVNWNDVESIQHIMPPLTSCTQRQVPLCMLLECQSDEERLIVVNWWRYLNSMQQPQILTELRRFYRAPMKSKDLMPDLRVVRDRKKERQLAPPWGFRCIETCQQLADKLDLTTDMIQTANIEPGTLCLTEGCIYPAICNNGGFCCLHRNAFAPMAGRERRKRGHLLLGSTYTRPSNKLCSCNDETCVGIGFAGSMVRFDITGLPEELQSEIWEAVMPRSRKTAALAPWHFHPQHRVFLPDGSWKIVEHRKNMVFRDPVSGKEWNSLPPPTYSPKDFLQEPEMIEYQKRKDTSLLPFWVREYQLLEEGPASIPEQQTNLLYNRINQLEQKLQAQACDFETSFRATEKEIAELRDKIEDKKLGGKRKRKRAGNDSNGGRKKRGAQDDETGNEIEEHHDFENGGGAIQGHSDGGTGTGQDQNQAQYAPTENYASYNQERARYTGAWN
ncbi:MAG: hypothetical protein SGILL_008468 [Bacillariaceae sp.]